MRITYENTTLYIEDKEDFIVDVACGLDMEVEEVEEKIESGEIEIEEGFGF